MCGGLLIERGERGGGGENDTAQFLPLLYTLILLPFFPPAAWLLLSCVDMSTHPTCVRKEKTELIPPNYEYMPVLLSNRSQTD